MVKRKFFNRIKAAFVGAAMIATSTVVPMMTYTSTTIVSAATKEVSSLPYTLVADGVKDGKRQANFSVPSSLKNASEIYLNFTTTCKEDATVGVYGFGTDASPWWADTKQETKTGGKDAFQVKVSIPAANQGHVNKIGVGIWYPEDNSEFTLVSMDGDGSGKIDPTPSQPVIPQTENDKSGTYTFHDNHDGTATIISTLSAQYKEEGETQFDWTLTQGHDEEQYAPYLDADGNPYPAYKEGDPINSHKFKFKNFGIADVSNIKFQSFQYVIKSDDYNMDVIKYGGGINVPQACDADTEYAKGKNGYWYNDQGEEDMTAHASDFKISDVHGEYEADSCGGYAKITWDVPASVQPFVDWSNADNAVGFQYWWGKDDSKTSTNEEGEEMNYAVIPEIHLVSCTATYTRTMTVPYNESIVKKDNIKLTSASEATKSAKINLSTLGLEDRDKLSAIRFSFDTKEAAQQFVGGMGISVDMSKANGVEGVDDGWYTPGDGNFTVINQDDGTFDVMWILPEAVGSSVYTGEEGSMDIGFYYADKEGGDTISSVTIPEIEYYVYRSQEDEFKIVDENGNEISDGDTIELHVGDTHQLNLNVDGVTFESDRINVATVDETGLITAVSDGLANVIATTPEGQEITFVVKVLEAVDPDTVIDWDKVFWGDVDVNGDVGISDIVALSKYLVNKVSFPLKNATAMENANCKYDDEINMMDNQKLIEYNLRKISLDDLGPTDPAIRAKASIYLKMK